MRLRLRALVYSKVQQVYILKIYKSLGPELSSPEPHRGSFPVSLNKCGSLQHVVMSRIILVETEKKLDSLVALSKATGTRLLKMTHSAAQPRS
jgi:hypothetical protein